MPVAIDLTSGIAVLDNFSTITANRYFFLSMSSSNGSSYQHECTRAINYRPSFTRSSLVKTIPENVGAGYIIAEISDYTKDDEGDVITYSLDSLGKQICMIDKKSGRLSLKKRLDREVRAHFEITVSAQDNHQGGGQHRSAMLPVFLYVLDINDNAPVFTGTPYIAKVAENATIGQAILTVAAYDLDDGQNKDISYSFKPGKGVEMFSIDKEKGTVTVAKKLDYETEKKYTLVVIAKDKGTPQSHESQTSLVIDVTDVCDTKPRFLQSSYQTQINENLKMGTVILTVKAVDGDTAVQHPVLYSIVDGNKDELFVIDSMSGAIKVNGTLDRETSNIFKLKVMDAMPSSHNPSGSDLGTPKAATVHPNAWEVPDNTAFTVVDVIILLNDVNDNKPIFLKTNYVFQIREDAKPGYVIAEQFSVADADIEKKNNKFEYRLEDANYVFSVDRHSGKLQLTGELNYERRSNYTFVIRAIETRTKERYNSSANVTIQVINVNDNKPIFQRLIYVFKVLENITTEKAIGKVKAVDNDAGTYGQVTYSIKSNRLGGPLFVINSKSGKIFITRPLDYSKFQVYTFMVIATDKGGDASLSSRALVQIVVIEVQKPLPLVTFTPTKITATVKSKRNDIEDVTEQFQLSGDSKKTKSSAARTQPARLSSAIVRAKSACPGGSEALRCLSIILMQIVLKNSTEMSAYHGHNDVREI
eukprot:gene11749-12969_t